MARFDHLSIDRRPAHELMGAPDPYDRYRDLQSYVGWTDRDTARIREIADAVRQGIPRLIEDFYAELQRHSETLRVITGGQPQIERLKASLQGWLSESLDCRSDVQYVTRRWKIGLRHAEIGLNPAYTAAAMARLRNGMIAIVVKSHSDDAAAMGQRITAIGKLLDLDLAIIQDAYQAEHLRREREAEHERSEVKFRKLVEAAACMVVILRADHRIVYFSPYSEELSGWPAADVVGRDFLEHFVPDWAQAAAAAEVAATFAGRPTRAYESPIRCRDGTQRWLVWNAQLLDDFEDQPAALAVGQDFTEWRDAQQRLLQNERLAGIGQMVTGIAHESRNALQRIQSSSEMLGLELEENERALRHVRRVQEAQDDLRRLLDEVRSFAAPIQLERRSSRLDSAWQQAWDSLARERQGRDAVLAVDAEPVDLAASLDHFRIVQLFRNLFENSLSACADPVRIRIACREVTGQGRDAIEVHVRDNGPGLSPEARRNVFEPFFTTKTKGTGLGMAIARRTVDAHGGRIVIGHSDTDGAEFIITLPRAAP